MMDSGHRRKWLRQTAQWWPRSRLRGLSKADRLRVSLLLRREEGPQRAGFCCIMFFKQRVASQVVQRASRSCADKEVVAEVVVQQPLDALGVARSGRPPNSSERLR